MTNEPKQKQEEEKEAVAAAAVCDNCEKLRNELSDCTAGWQRALADYQNLQKETEKRRGEWAEYARQMILEEFIPVYEHLKLALQESANKTAWLEGVKHVAKQFADILKNNGVEEIKTVGEKFDPALHEAVGEEDIASATPPTPSWKEGDASSSPQPDLSADEAEGGHRGVGESGTIIKETSGGYKMGERVIRAAKVIVSK